MGNLADKQIIVGVTGGIAAYKTAELVRQLRRAGAQVRVVMTAAAQAFVTPLSFQALSGHRVYCDMLDTEHESAMGHIELARWAHCLLIAPASADFIARIAHGHANDLLSTLCLATPADLFIAPAMNQQMWRNAAVQDNIDILKKRNLRILGPAEGEQACGDTGPGRMQEPFELLEALSLASASESPLQDCKVLITAGPTQEPIDPVRFISNRSSGKMGYALAQAMRDRGAQVVLVSGPVSRPPPPGIDVIAVRTAEEMYQAVIQALAGVNIFIGSAAVADYTPAQQYAEKIKKNGSVLELDLRPTKDILGSVATSAAPPFTVGFAAETTQLEKYARGKLENKQIDMIAANQVGTGRGGFYSDENSLLVIWKGGSQVFAMQNKVSLAQRLADLIVERYDEHKISGSL
ncbi:MAG: bifunctional phosphopantothenoylcysteine decarboxylase/phosphopantothenate--cysteine ligase CoaBC [gamma proteobacterium symbiont of Bathyaustriella thionipta]|nr:bifunctional phosphopantothenoylcysteine decarboxylase/phosphopantothenate--cysteine ligase CoaBC [gamma proteobacterium symbiont of Bathyaustriella thionipta]